MRNFQTGVQCWTTLRPSRRSQRTWCKFLKTSELTESKAFIRSFVKEIAVAPGKAIIRYSIPMPYDSRIPGRDSEELALNGPVLPTVPFGTPYGIRTRDLRLERPTC